MLEETKQEKIQCDILIRDCSALVEGMQIKEHLAIAIKDGKILDILPQAQAGKYEAQEIITEQDKLWLPGLVDAHMHTGQQLLKGRVLDELPMIWTRIMLPFESTMTAAKMRLSAQVAALEPLCFSTPWSEAGVAAELEKRGFAVDPSTAKYKGEKLTAVYLRQDFGGFAIHLVQK